MKGAPDPSILTKRLVLSRIARADVDDLVAMLRNPGLYGFIGDAPASEADARARAERWLAGSPDPTVLWINYVARTREDGMLVGLAQATVLRASETVFGQCEIAYLVDPPAQRHGYGAEMMVGFCVELNGTLAPEEFTAHIFPGHTASEGVAKAVGLSPTEDYVDGERVWRATASRMG
ncbi:GNAT family N-acetyltransferase [Actinophytocola oryzae]|uniref:RimJ/RimL family protein N-acetyltransferase n=1 Tax=Actinophytocola oryzae TaxID=502181 RepID=A0A4R7W4P6_9PSEU|nr:GNAT family N-acetyltransferase [Actinophytocola oryzae]TDV57700.1 RimJ/RimL family protein N-acetyltransferase [Actinophytocola oryzae]